MAPWGRLFLVLISLPALRFLFVWEGVLLLPGAGNSIANIDYVAIDTDPYYGGSYYRLKQTDFDGTTSYSEMRMVTLGDFGDRLTLFPNPSHRLIHLTGAVDEFADLKVYDVSGQDVTSTVKIGFGGDRGSVTMDISALPKGTYLVKTQTSTLRLLKE